jgi:hypothetical protein
MARAAFSLVMVFPRPKGCGLIEAGNNETPQYTPLDFRDQSQFESPSLAERLGDTQPDLPQNGPFSCF